MAVAVTQGVGTVSSAAQPGLPKGSHPRGQALTLPTCSDSAAWAAASSGGCRCDASTSCWQRLLEGWNRTAAALGEGSQQQAGLRQRRQRQVMVCPPLYARASRFYRNSSLAGAFGCRFPPEEVRGALVFLFPHLHLRLSGGGGGSLRPRGESGQ